MRRAGDLGNVQARADSTYCEERTMSVVLIVVALLLLGAVLAFVRVGALAWSLASIVVAAAAGLAGGDALKMR